ncbi:hypothetical protein JIQ42_01094 [Leishmania sp. Namibia]|uniref:hypothetical protein n=1 Tax=Leishmania sp. Namibia TaxID=2802991 RepID=UPI001B54F20B|nr:hypothetical protein JIQ42_01094 [Leishmania sp. Namibia]
MPKTQTQGGDVRRGAVCAAGARMPAHRFCEVFSRCDVTMNALERSRWTYSTSVVVGDMSEVEVVHVWRTE